MKILWNQKIHSQWIYTVIEFWILTNPNDIFEGNVDFGISFTYGEGTATYRSCGATLNGEFIMIGGGSDKTQVKSQNKWPEIKATFSDK